MLSNKELNTDLVGMSSEKAGYDWEKMFLIRNSDISLMKSEGVSSSERKITVEVYYKTQLVEDWIQCNISYSG